MYKFLSFFVAFQTWHGECNNDGMNKTKLIHELAIQNLKLIQDQGNLTTDDEKKSYVRQVLLWVKTRNVQALKDAVSSEY